MKKIIIFDFDGVFVQSNQIKTLAFIKVYKKLGLNNDQLKYIENFHKKNLGMSRFEKFKILHKFFFDINLNKNKLKKLSETFGEIVLNKIVSMPLSRCLKNFLKRNHKKYYFYISTGTPTKEIKKIIKIFCLEKYFIKIYGSPLNKNNHIKKIIKNKNFNKKNIFFIGDSEIDYKTSNNNNIKFILFKNKYNKVSNFKNKIFYIKNFCDFNKKLNNYI